MKLAKWHGLGNDYLVVEESALPVPLDADAVVLLCDRHTGVGSDGILLRCPPTGAVPGAITRMRIFNPDGSESEMCGNGIRIFARYLALEGAIPSSPGSECIVETAAGPIMPRLLQDGMVRVDMGWARFQSPSIDTSLVAATAPDGMVDATLRADGSAYRFTFVDVGNPHCVTLVDDPAGLDLPTVGPLIERHPAFPNRVNVEFVRVEDDDSVRMRVWERGVGETQACGTGAAAVGAAAVRLGITSSPVTVHLLGGDLVIEVQGAEDDVQAGVQARAPHGVRVFMTGPAEQIFTCELSDELTRRLGWPSGGDGY